MAGIKNSICTVGLISLLLSWSAQGQSILPVEYLYDADGNMISDANKDIAAIHYNLLNLPDTITYSDGRKIVYVYTAAGQKIRQQVFRTDGTVETKRDYAGQFLYENDLLKTLDHGEGRVVMSGTTPEYQYHLKDHLGNVRMTVTSLNETVEYLATMEQEKAGGEGLLFDDISFRSGNGLANHTPEGNEAIYLPAGTEQRASFDLAVSRGDVIYLQVYAYYENGVTSDPWPGGGGETSLAKGAATIVSAVAGALSGGVLAGEGGALLSSGTTAGSLLVAPPVIDESAPVAYLNYELFNKNYSLVDGGFRKVSSEALFSQELLTLGPIEVTESGYLHVSLSNLSAQQGVYFDDLKVQHTRGQIVQEDSYDPFGMPLAGLHEARYGEVENRRLYNGKELQNDHDLNWYDYGARMYDAALGRWHAIDPLGDKYASWSPYQYVLNNPLKFIDPTGMEVTHCQPNVRAETQAVRGAAAMLLTRLAPEGRRIVEDAENNDKVHVYIMFQDRLINDNGFKMPGGTVPPSRLKLKGGRVSYPKESPVAVFNGLDLRDDIKQGRKVYLVTVSVRDDNGDLPLLKVADIILHEFESHVNIPEREAATIDRMRKEDPEWEADYEIHHWIYGTPGGADSYEDGKAVNRPGTEPRNGTSGHRVVNQLAALQKRWTILMQLLQVIAEKKDQKK
jgi:RHS repeat-associated protein